MFEPFSKKEIDAARVDTGPCHPECEEMRQMEGRWVATLDLAIRVACAASRDAELGLRQAGLL
jgi:hypothetical protein